MLSLLICVSLSNPHNNNNNNASKPQHVYQTVSLLACMSARPKNIHQPPATTQISGSSSSEQPQTTARLKSNQSGSDRFRPDNEKTETVRREDDSITWTHNTPASSGKENCKRRRWALSQQVSQSKEGIVMNNMSSYSYVRWASFFRITWSGQTETHENTHHSQSSHVLPIYWFIFYLLLHNIVVLSAPFNTFYHKNQQRKCKVNKTPNKCIISQTRKKTHKTHKKKICSHNPTIIKHTSQSVELTISSI